MKEDHVLSKKIGGAFKRCTSGSRLPKRFRSGFTLVELIIVIVIIGILSSISIIGYNSVKDRGVDAKVKADFTNIHKAANIYKANGYTFTALTDVDGDAILGDADIVQLVDRPGHPLIQTAPTHPWKNKSEYGEYEYYWYLASSVDALYFETLLTGASEKWHYYCTINYDIDGDGGLDNNCVSDW
jgi:general secretion pathway protein G